MVEEGRHKVIFTLSSKYKYHGNIIAACFTAGNGTKVMYTEPLSYMQSTATSFKVVKLYTFILASFNTQGGERTASLVEIKPANEQY